MAQKLKKIFLLLSLLLSFSLPVFAVDYCQDANVIGAYYFNETSGSADDCSSNNRDLTNTGPTLNVTGVFGSGYSYDGTNDVSSSTNAGFDFTGGETANFTVIFHANIASSQADGGRVVHRGESGVNGYQIVADTNGTIVAGGYNTNSWQVREEITYTADSYAHYAFVYTASGGSFTDVDIFLNGVSQTTASDATNWGWNANGTWYIGGRGNGFYTDADFDEPAVFNDQLTSTEINDILDNGLTSVSGTTIQAATLQGATIN